MGSPPTRPLSSCGWPPGGPLRARRPDAGQPAVRRARHLRGRHRRAGPDGRVRARPRPRRLSRASPRPTTTRSPTSSSCAAATSSVIAPASANTIAKLAAGLADNLLTSAALACTAPLVVAPAMNNAMYEHPATRANLEMLRERGVAIVEPGRPARLRGRVGHRPPGRACRHPRGGRGAARRATRRVARRAAVLVTAGGTREPIDTVRYVGNRSSGRMGFALAEEAAARGADVTVIAANVSLPAPGGVRVVEVETAAELRRPRARPSPTPTCCSWRRRWPTSGPPRPLEDKIAKAGRDWLELRARAHHRRAAALSGERRPGPDARRLRRRARRGGVERGRGKLERKGLDAVVVNDISRPDIGFDAPDNEVTIVTAAGEHTSRCGSKRSRGGGDPRRGRGAADQPRQASTVEGEA